MCARPWAAAFLITIALIAGAPAYAADEGAPDEGAAASRAALQLVNAQLPSGQFAFDYDFLRGRGETAPKPGFDRWAFITREAAAAYGLSKYLLHDKDARVGAALAAALRYLENSSLPIAKARGQKLLEATGILAVPFGRYKLLHGLSRLGLLYSPAGDGRLVSDDRTYETAWGGATALALLSELQYARASGDTQFAGLGRAWLKGLLVLYDRGRGFRALPGSIDENALSNGEIWLAFASYARSFPDDREAAAVVARLDDYMMTTYGARPDAGFYAWGTQAAAERFAATSDAKFSRFIARQARAFLDKLAPSVDPSANSCDVVEGLAAALRVLSSAPGSDPKLVQRLRRRIDDEMAKNLSLQIQPGQTRIDFGSGAYLSSPALANYAGAFLAGKDRPYVRVDYTEHCISALVELGENR